MSEHQLTDLTFLKSFTGNDNEKVKKYVGMFLSRAPEQLAAINQSLDNKDYDSLKVNAHSLKPQLAYMGIKSLEQDILTIEENSGSKTNLDTLPELVAKLNTQLNRSFDELQAHLNNL